MNGNPLAEAALVCHDRSMPKPDKHERRPSDINQLAKRLVAVSTGENGDTIAPPTKSQISMLMSELGRKGGKKGGKRRLETMTAKERTAAARKAAQARWQQRGK